MLITKDVFEEKKHRLSRFSFRLKVARVHELRHFWWYSAVQRSETPGEEYVHCSYRKIIVTTIYRIRIGFSRGNQSLLEGNDGFMGLGRFLDIILQKLSR